MYVVLARNLIDEIFSSEHDEVQQAQVVQKILNKIMLLFPWQLLKDNNKYKSLESTYNVMLSSFLQSGCSGHTYLGNEISCCSAGDIECAIECEDKSVVVIFEFKRCGNTRVAMDQMKNKGFADSFSNETLNNIRGHQYSER